MKSQTHAKKDLKKIERKKNKNDTCAPGFLFCFATFLSNTQSRYDIIRKLHLPRFVSGRFYCTDFTLASPPAINLKRPTRSARSGVLQIAKKNK